MAIDLCSKCAFEAIGTAKSMVFSVPGQGSQYIGADSDWLIGGNSYHNRLPRDVPANMSRSLKVYGNKSRSIIQSDSG